mgnify:CR=1 FL=1
MKRVTLALVLTTTAGLLFVLPRSAIRAADAPKKVTVGEAAPDFELKDVYGKSFRLGDFKGKVVVLEWINQACPVSRGKHDDGVMQKSYKRYASRGVIWLAVDSTNGRKPEENRVYAAEQGLAYPILDDSEGKVGHAFGARTTPHMFVVDKNGTLVYDGAIDDKTDKKNYVTAAVEDLLANRPVKDAKTTPYGCSVKYKR